VSQCRSTSSTLRLVRHLVKFIAALMFVAVSAGCSITIGGDTVGFLAFDNDTDASWFLVTIDGTEQPQDVEHAVLIRPHEKGTLSEGIGFSFTNVVVLLFTNNCRLADAETISSGRQIWVQISADRPLGPLHEIKLPAEVPIPQPLPDGTDCIAPGVVLPNR
jgi:hypothetical protein